MFDLTAVAPVLVIHWPGKLPTAGVIDLVRARGESDRLASRMHAHDRVAPEHQPAIR